MSPQSGYHASTASTLIPSTEADPRSAIPTQFLLPAVHDHYRTGRFLAVVSGILGWLVLGFGVAAVVAGTGLVPGSGKFIGLVPGLVYGAAGLFAGLLMVFVSQLARAIFDNANAVRDLAAIERARVRQRQPRN